MKNMDWEGFRRLRPHIIVWVVLAFTFIWPPGTGFAKPRPPLPPLPEAGVLRNWRFDDVGGWPPPMLMPLQAENISLVESWSGYAVRVAGDQSAVLEYAEVEGDGRTNIHCRAGAIRFWFRPDWDSADLGGKGPGTFARLIEMGQYSEQASLGWWSLYLNPAGTAIYFSAQARGRQADYLKAPIQWQAGVWHEVLLSYDAKASALYLDGELAAEGSGVTLWPPDKVRAALGFTLGGTGTGESLAQGEFDGLTTYARPRGLMEVNGNYRRLAGVAARGPISAAEGEQARLARTTPIAKSTLTPAGGGVGSSPAGANFGPNDLWLEIFPGTNSAPLTLHNTTNGVRYQLLSRPEVAQPPWLVEQTLFGAAGTNSPTTVFFNERPNRFFWAGVDSDGDGLIDDLETLNGTSPQNQDSDNDGVNDYVEVIQGRDPLNGVPVADTSGLVNLQVYTPLR